MIDMKKFLNLLVRFEGLRTKAYRDSAGIPTIGIGTIRYPDGTPVKMGDTCTAEQAYAYAEADGRLRLQSLMKMLKVEQTENQLTALLSLGYNIGTEALRSSSVLKAINGKKPIPDIERFWMLWNKATVNGEKKAVKGLTARRAYEVKVYKGEVKLQ